MYTLTVVLRSSYTHSYKSFKGVYKFTQKDESTCIANLWIEYEKLNENVEAPDRYVGLMVKLVQDLDAHFLGA
ncbi:hypothetical protein C1H46_037930 [Malus baccata]|uniref:Bet v I/Major latex protein domain-containing protein n=1 Tax=Malus baccata TaxID=106549 RepID=A0A540KQK7_MALBA|nr:hypothetical protein C1H46_037930 [Malus baccata]